MAHHLPRRTSTLGRIAVAATLLLACVGTSPWCLAQKNSGAGAITITAVLPQSLTMSVTPAVLNSGSSPDYFGGDARGGTSVLTIATTWVRGPASVGVGVFAPGNPLLGVAGRALVPVAYLESAATLGPSGDTFLSALREPASSGLPGIRINTGDLQVPDGSDAGMLTIRAQVL
jgi:hypothetical protein